MLKGVLGKGGLCFFGMNFCLLLLLSATNNNNNNNKTSMAANTNTDLSNPQISVSFLRNYPALKDKKDEQLQKIVGLLEDEMITEKGHGS